MSVILKREPKQEIIAWCGACGKTIYAEEDVVRKELAQVNDIAFVAAVCSTCAELPDVWERFAVQVRNWLAAWWRNHA